MKCAFKALDPILALAYFVVAPGPLFAAQPDSSPAAAAVLPLKEIILYSSGVGFFQREGELEGNARIDLRFKAEDINDLLKSLVVQDLRGQLGTVTYDSRDPFSKTLKSFGIDLTANPSLADLLNQARGEAVEIYWPNPVQGKILGVERKMEVIDEKRSVEVSSLNLLTSEGLQSIPLAQVKRIRLLNERLNLELKQALDVLATSHDTQKKTIAITFQGNGRRPVRVGYILQTPVWKTSYRLVLKENGPAYLQGWAIVENTTDEDWDNIRLSLISGRPISFVMDLYQPLYTTRPVVEPELYLSLRPPIHLDAMDKRGMQAEAAGQVGGGGFGGGGRAAGDQVRGRLLERAAPAAAVHAFGLMDIKQGLVELAQAAESGELFKYDIQSLVSLPRQKSALLPIVSQPLEAEKLSIYNESIQAKHPLNGLRLKNTTSLHLMQGPITLFDEGSYAGDARIEDLAPGQDRLISYALDLQMEVEPQATSRPEELVQVQLKKGALIASRKAVREKIYLAKNRDQKSKRLLIEHPFEADWKLIAPAKPEERTRDVYRFKAQIEPNAKEQLIVREEKQYSEQVELSNVDSRQIAIYLRSTKVTPAVKQALEKLTILRDRLNQTAALRQQREKRIEQISQEQARIRENMSRLSQSAELYQRYVKKFDDQETEIENIRQEISRLSAEERQQQNELDQFLQKLDVG